MPKQNLMEWARHIGYILCKKTGSVTVETIEQEMLKRGLITPKTPPGWRANALKSACFAPSGHAKDSKTGRRITRFVLDKKRFKTAAEKFEKPPVEAVKKQLPKKLAPLPKLVPITQQELLAIVLCYAPSCLTCNSPATRVDKNGTERCDICAPPDCTLLPMSETLSKLGELHATGEGYAFLDRRARSVQERMRELRSKPAQLPAAG